jgi:hypothetical protein
MSSQSGRDISSRKNFFKAFMESRLTLETISSCISKWRPNNLLASVPLVDSILTANDSPLHNALTFLHYHIGLMTANICIHLRYAKESLHLLTVLSTVPPVNDCICWLCWAQAHQCLKEHQPYADSEEKFKTFKTDVLHGTKHKLGWQQPSRSDVHHGTYNTLLANVRLQGQFG